MLKKVLEYTDYNGNEVKETLHFHLTKPEVLKLSARYDDDIEVYIGKVVAAKDTNAVFAIIEDLILSAYGEKSEDGKRFVKTPKIREEFEYSIAYAELFEELLTGPGAAKAFGEGLVSTAQSVKQAQADNVRNLVD